MCTSSDLNQLNDAADISEASMAAAHVLYPSSLDYNLHDGDPAQTVMSRYRDYGTSGISHPAMACICGADLAVRIEEGKLDV